MLRESHESGPKLCGDQLEHSETLSDSTYFGARALLVLKDAAEENFFVAVD
jgi:hypothetical protein